jgi:elongation factor 1-gamma
LFAGVLVLLGRDVEPVVNVAPDWESYSYAKLDVKDNAHPTIEALVWDLWSDGKNVSFEKLDELPSF